MLSHFLWLGYDIIINKFRNFFLTQMMISGVIECYYNFQQKKDRQASLLVCYLGRTPLQNTFRTNCIIFQMIQNCSKWWAMYKSWNKHCCLGRHTSKYKVCYSLNYSNLITMIKHKLIYTQKIKILIQ